MIYLLSNDYTWHTHPKSETQLQTRLCLRMYFRFNHISSKKNANRISGSKNSML